MKAQIIALLTAGLVIIPISLTEAFQSPDGTVTFDAAPRLIGATVPYNSITIKRVKYYFTIELPEKVGEPLQKVVFEQKPSQEDIRFRLEDTVAFMGTPDDKGQTITISNVEQQDKKTISVTLDTPIPPGNTLTIGLTAVENPRYGGVYQFGVTAFPVGEKPQGLYLGVGRLQFYDDLPF